MELSGRGGSNMDKGMHQCLCSHPLAPPNGGDILRKG